MKNRFKLQQMLDGVRSSLLEANEKLTALYENTTSNITDRGVQAQIVKDLEEREKGIADQIEQIDNEARAKLEAEAVKSVVGEKKEEKIINAKATLIKNVMIGKSVPTEVKAVLGDGTTLGNGDKILPRTMTNELIHEPMVKNPLKGHSTFTNIANLEVPRILFSLDDDDFLAGDSETAKELKSDTDTVIFERKKFKVFCDITETVLNGTQTNLVSTVEAALESGLAKKEMKIAFATTAPTDMSFYNKSAESGTPYLIKEITEANLYLSIAAALADLEDDYASNAKIAMRKSDYFKIINLLANGNLALFAAPPEQVLGAPVVFCNMATIPVVGDFNYSHYNYDLNMIYDRDKNVKTGIESFVLTAWLDHKIKIKSAFRLATVTP